MGNKKRGLVSYSEMENETNPLRFLQYSDDFSDGVNDTEQKPDDQGKSSDETADDNVKCEYADCCGNSKAEGDKPEAHPSDAEW